MQILTRRTYYWLSSLFLGLTLSFLLPWPRAHADGGAPNLSYVAGTSHSISIIDVLQQRVISTIPLGGDPHTVLLSLDGRVLYVSQPALGRVAMLDTKTGKTICTVSLPGQPSLLALDPRPEINVLYAAGNGATTISVLNPTTCALQRIFKTQSPVYGLAVAFMDPDKGYQLWVADKTSLTVFDEHTGRQLATIPISGGPEYLCIPSDTTVYLTTRQGKAFAVDIDTKQVSPPLLTNGKFGPM